MEDLIIILIAVVSSAFIFLLFRSLFKLLSFQPIQDGKDASRILKIFMPTIIGAIVVVLFFVLVVPRYS